MRHLALEGTPGGALLPGALKGCVLLRRSPALPWTLCAVRAWSTPGVWGTWGGLGVWARGRHGGIWGIVRIRRRGCVGDWGTKHWRALLRRLRPRQPAAINRTWRYGRTLGRPGRRAECTPEGMYGLFHRGHHQQCPPQAIAYGPPIPRRRGRSFGALASPPPPPPV